MIPVDAGTVVVFSDLACPWAHLAVHRLHAVRHRLGLEGRVAIVHRAFPLELVNGRGTPRRVLDAELPVAGGLDPAAGWQIWQGADWEWPVTTLPALEAVQAAALQSFGAAEQLDARLRRAFFAESRCISLRTVILDLAADCPAVDVHALAASLDDGRARRTVLDDLETARSGGVVGSPHLFLADGGEVFNPGVRVRWEGKHGRGFPIVEQHDPSVYEPLLLRAADPAGASTAG